MCTYPIKPWFLKAWVFLQTINIHRPYNRSVLVFTKYIRNWDHRINKDHININININIYIYINHIPPTLKYSLHPPLARLASAMDRLDAIGALRQQRDTAQEMGIYESCVSALPDFSQARLVKGSLLVNGCLWLVEKKLMVIDGCW